MCRGLVCCVPPPDTILDYLLNNGWRGRSVRLTLVVKDEINPDTMKRLRGPEQSMASASEESPRLQPAYHTHGPPILASNPPPSQAYVGIHSEQVKLLELIIATGYTTLMSTQATSPVLAYFLLDQGISRPCHNWHHHL